MQKHNRLLEVMIRTADDQTKGKQKEQLTDLSTLALGLKPFQGSFDKNLYTSFS